MTQIGSKSKVKGSDLLKVVIRLGATDQNALFQHSELHYFKKIMTSVPG